VKRYPRSAAAGINRAAQGAYTLAVREIQADIGASSQKTIRRNLSLTKATGEKPQARLTGFSSKKDRIPIYEMKPKPQSVTKRRPAGGVKYGAQAKLIPSSFIAKMESGHTGVFKRIGKFSVPSRGRYAGKIYASGRHAGLPVVRENIKELFGPSVALVFKRKKITDKIRAYLREKVPQEIARAFKFVTG
jgi:hypothetical protein